MNIAYPNKHRSGCRLLILNMKKESEMRMNTNGLVSVLVGLAVNLVLPGAVQAAVM